MYYYIYKTTMGNITIFYDDNGITKVYLPYDEIKNISKAVYREDKKIKKYFDEYFLGGEPEPLRLNIYITEFQKKVFDVLINTSRGTVLTYGDIAKLIKCKSNQAVGQALKRNPVPILIPCHRVVGKGWDGGFGGETIGNKIAYKKYLLEIEKKNLRK